MAIYHLSLKAIQRSKGRSATASAAYRSRSKITDKRTGFTYDYTRKKGIEARAIFTPDSSQISRAELWNMAEAAERRKDGITAREWEIALPCELDKEQRMELVRDFCLMLTERYEVAADVAIHAPTQEGDQRNFHAHVQTTTRRLVGGSLGAKSDFELSGTERRKKGLKSQKEELEDIRQQWERMVNAILEKAGRPERVSSKSLAAQGESRPPTVHLGVAATAMERRGIQTERGDLNRWPILRRMYGELRAMQKNLRTLEADLARIQKGEAYREIEKSKDFRRDGGRGQKRERPGFTDTQDAKPVGGDTSAAGRFETAPERSGRAEKRDPESERRARKDFRGTGENLRNARGISGKGQAGGLSSRPDGSREAGRDERANRSDLGSSSKARKENWLEKLRELEEAIIRRLIEYRTIGDLLAMNQGREEEKQAQKEADEAKKRFQGPK